MVDIKQLEKLGFKLNDGVWVSSTGRDKIFVKGDTFTVSNPKNVLFVEDSERLLKRLGITYEPNTEQSKKLNTTALFKAGFRFDKNDTEYWCRRFSDHHVCIDENSNIHFYVKDLESFMPRFEEEQTIWKKRLSAIGIKITKVYKPEEYI